MGAHSTLFHGKIIKIKCGKFGLVIGCKLVSAFIFCEILINGIGSLFLEIHLFFNEKECVYS